MPMLERIMSIYTAMLGVGEEVAKVLDKGKGDHAVNQVIQSQSLENLPAQEDLISVVGPEQQTLVEYLDFVEPPDIQLEDEQCWPVKPDLDY